MNRTLSSCAPSIGSFLRRVWLLPAAFLLVFLWGADLSAQDSRPAPVQNTVAQAGVVPSRVTQQVSDAQQTRLVGNTHPLARAEFDRGAAPPELPMERMLLLLQRSPEQEAALHSLLEEQQNPSSRNYHNWLTPGQFGQLFGPSDHDVQAVTSWLTSRGFRVTQISAGRNVIEFSGTAATVQQALGTAIHKFSVNGEDHWANVEDPQIPTALAPVVAGVVSLHNFRKQPMLRNRGEFFRSPDSSRANPLFTTSSGHFAVSPFDFATIYNVLPLWNAIPAIDGTGQSIAIVGRTNINIQDVRDYRNLFGLPAKDPTIILNGPDPGIVTTMEETEADLDVQLAGAVAKNANILFVVSESTQTTDGVDLSALYIVDNNLAPILSESFGQCELALGTAGNQFYFLLWQQASAQGMTAILPTGDSGSAGCDSGISAVGGIAVSGLASTPFNVAMGGTDFDDVGNTAQFWNVTNDPVTRASAKSYIFELPWNDSCAQAGLAGCTTPNANGADLSAGGGGPSNCITSNGINPATCSSGYAKPSWQTGTGVPNDGKRDIPDASLFSGDGKNLSSYAICQADAVTGNPSCNPAGTFSFLGVGGTSAATPTFAGIMALVNQKTGSRQGNANFVLYRLAAVAGKSCNASDPATITNANCIFYDTTKGNISVICAGGSFNCSKTSAGGFGIIVDPSNSSSPAWTTTTGYDRATGLGSVNAANLVNNWTSASFTGSGTALTNVSPLTITHGASVTGTITVTQNSGSVKPTGDVALLGGPGGTQVGIDGFTLSNGSVNFTTHLLPGSNPAGTAYPIFARYSGDGTFKGSDSTAVMVTVNPESSKTFLSMITFDPLTGAVTNFNATSAIYGSPYILRVDVGNSSSVALNTCSPNPTGETACPTGTVTLTDNSQPLDGGTFTLNAQGHLEDQPIQLPAGAHSLRAAYNGDPSFSGSASPTVNFTVTKAATAAAASSNLANAASGAPVTLTATISTQSNAVANAQQEPTGNVQFFVNSTAFGNPVTVTGGVNSITGFAQAAASLTTSTLPNGNNSITVQYLGDTNYLASSLSAAIGVFIGGDFTLNSQQLSSTITAGASAMYSISATGSNGFSGSINLSCAVQSPVSTSFPPACNFDHTSITPGGNPSSSTMTASTTARAMLPPPPAWRVPPQLRTPLVLLALVMFTAMLFFARARRRLAAVLSLAALLCILLPQAGCGGTSGGGGGTRGTPAGTYTIVITGTSGSVTNTLNVTLVVN